MPYDKKIIKQKSAYLPLDKALKLERVAKILKISDSKLMTKWIVEKLEEQLK